MSEQWIKTHPDSKTAIYSYDEVPGDGAVIIVHERLGARALAGAGLILAGILLAELKGPVPASEEIHHDV
jgi:drug/metabolite transporter (DMT)-like permease